MIIVINLNNIYFFQVLMHPLDLQHLKQITQLNLIKAMANGLKENRIMQLAQVKTHQCRIIIAIMFHHLNSNLVHQLPITMR